MKRKYLKVWEKRSKGRKYMQKYARKYDKVWEIIKKYEVKIWGGWVWETTEEENQYQRLPKKKVKFFEKMMVRLCKTTI